MWNKRQLSQLLLVKINTGDFRLTLPISLLVLEDLVNSLGDLLELADLFIPGSAKLPFRLAWLAQFSRTMLAEMRSYGRWDLLEVEVPDTRIYVKFY